MHKYFIQYTDSGELDAETICALNEAEAIKLLHGIIGSGIHVINMIDETGKMTCPE